MKALDLFGGKEHIIDSINKGVWNALKTIPMGDLSELSVSLDIPFRAFSDIVEKKSKADFNLFEKLKGPLGLSIIEILGNPIFQNDATKEYWERQFSDQAPMLLTGKIPGDEEEGRPVINDAKAKSAGFELYVRLRAVEELAWNI